MEELDLNKYERTSTGRIDMSKTFSNVPLPNLCDVQLQSFKWFSETGVDEVFKDIFPIQSNKDTRGHETDTEQIAELDYVKSEWGNADEKHGYFECKVSALTYSAPLHVTLRLKHPDGTVSEEKIFMGDFPWITPSGTFIINGSEKCIASQLVRSPGAYVSKEADEVTVKKSDNDAKNEINLVYGSDIIPARGIWLEYLTDSRDFVSVRIDKQKKVPALVLLRALGIVSDADSLNDQSLPANSDGTASPAVTGVVGLFGENSYLAKALEKNSVNANKGALDRAHEAVGSIFRKLRPGEPYTAQSAASTLKQRFFENEHYDLGKAGRFKINDKLGVYERLIEQTLAEDLISRDGEIVYEAGHTLTTEEVIALKRDNFFDNNENHTVILSSNEELDNHNRVNLVKIKNPNDPEKVIHVVGTDLTVNLTYVTIPDIVASLSYMLNLIDGVGYTDDTDHLGNKRVRCVGELIQDKFRAGLSKMKRTIHDRMSTSDLASMNISSLINIKALTSAVNQFFNSDSLSQFMDQTNPLAELTNKRRLSALGRGGLTRDRASSAVRDVHPTHYGRICPIETPEGQNIGLISNLACYAKVNEYGFLQTPYRPVHDRIVDNDKDHVLWLTAAEERNHVICQANVVVSKDSNRIEDDTVAARFNGEYITAKAEECDLIDASPKQIVSIAAACIPFLENDDGKRALMGSNMQRQALPLLRPEAPYVGTGLEEKIAHDSGEALLAYKPGYVDYVDSRQIVIIQDDGTKKIYKLRSFVRSNKRTCISQSPKVHVGDHVEAGDIIANGPSMDKGELALGQNAVVAFTTWHGYNYEDAVVISERCVNQDLFTNLIIEEYPIERRKTKLGDEEFTRNVPNLGEDKKTYLDEKGIVVPGTEVHEGDILVGKTTPKGEVTETNNDHLLKSIFSSKSDEDKDTSLRVPHGGEGIVLDVRTFSRDKGDELPPDVLESAKVYVVQKRKIQVGDKMSGRHGNKGVISRVLPVEDMPYLPDGTPVDILLSPMGVPSRMNIGQVLEVQLGLACKKLGIKVSTPVFDGASNEEIAQFMEKAGIDSDGKTVLYDGQTGERFDSRIAVGVMYMIKLDHMVEDKIHARAIGPYSLVTQQPLGGKAQNGGQRFGEMEVWALEAYGAAYTLQEMLTIKSDDMVGRNKTYEAILKGNQVSKPNMPESTRVLIKELQGLGIDVNLLDDKNQPINMDTISEEAEREGRRTHHDIVNFDTKRDEEDELEDARNAALDEEIDDEFSDNENPETDDFADDDME
ncbi:DNA-directed RNA polymerase subunit beta [Treponema rectale]|uniref:DNA-directed RNA polymerase subunit beta n=1 Tax=Treponema rectale TaxID=744512 RepID=A0A7M1XI38_9SPIR|nr:DNA-directed RNA polymerase subunit beta [Treponema rectale]